MGNGSVAVKTPFGTVNSEILQDESVRFALKQLDRAVQEKHTPAPALPPVTFPDYPTMITLEAVKRARREGRNIRFRTPSGLLMNATPSGLELLPKE